MYITMPHDYTHDFNIVYMSQNMEILKNLELSTTSSMKSLQCTVIIKM